MEISYEYTKKRKDFSLPCQLNDTPTQLLHTIEPNKKEVGNWTQRFSTTVELDCIPEVAEMKVISYSNRRYTLDYAICAD
jgi:hypothetical protein